MTGQPPDDVARSVQVALTDGVLHVLLSRGEKNNALGPALVRALRTALGQAEVGQAVLITAEGRNFCAGGDHDELAALPRDAFRHYLADLVGLFADLAGSQVPVVVGVQRAVVGGGLELCLLADFVVAADDAWFELPQVRLGGRIGTYTYRNLIARSGLSVTRRLALLGERFDVATALGHGLVDQVVERPQLEEAAARMAAQLASQPAISLGRARSELTELLSTAGKLREEADRLAERSGA